MLVLALGAGVVVAAPLFSIERFEVTGENPLPPGETERVLRPFRGPQDSIAGVEEAAQALENAIKATGSYFHRVIVPPQRAAGGVFRLEVITFEIAAISVEGNEHFDEVNILRSLPALEPGETPNSLAVARSLQLANRHSARRVAVFMREAEGGGALAAQVRVRDSRPWVLFAGLDNMGDEQTGVSRLSFGAQHTNLLNRDHSLTLSYTTSPENFEGVRQFGAFYRLPLYRAGGELSAFYTHSEIDTGRVAGAFDVSGAGDFAGLRYRHILRPRGNYNHSVRFSLDDRLFENDTTFDGQPIGVDVRSRPFGIGYTGRVESGRERRQFDLQFLRNLGTGEDNTDLAYRQNRAGADKAWFALRFGASASQPLPREWTLEARLDGQYSPDLLVSGEQFGLGGTFSVRGFEEREISGDMGMQASVEVRTPPLPGNARLLGFIDAGVIDFGEEDQTGAASEVLASAGLGLRWRWRQYVSLRLDVAYVVEGNGLALSQDRTRADTVDFHSGISVRF